MSAPRSTTSMTDRSAYRQVSGEVFHAVAGVVTFDAKDLRDLEALAQHTPRHRARYCAHSDPASALQEMLIVHPKGAYVRPHKHLGKAESTLVISGEVLYLVFDDEGRVSNHYRMAPAPDGRPFFVRVAENTFHTLIILSDWLTFIEGTTGPFDRAQTVFAPWSPADSDIEGARGYIQDLIATVGG